MSPPGPEKERALTGKASARQGSKLTDAITAPVKIKLLVFQDWCIEDCLSYLEHEHYRLGGGPSGGHILHCLRARYAEFLCSDLQKDQYRTWVAIQTLAAWLKQLEANEN